MRKRVSEEERDRGRGRERERIVEMERCHARESKINGKRENGKEREDDVREGKTEVRTITKRILGSVEISNW